MAINKPETSGPAFGKSSKPYKPETLKSPAPATTEVKLPGVPPMPPPDPVVLDEPDLEPHPEHIAGQKAVEHFAAKKQAEFEAGQKAVARHPHRFK
jgi:hypothetical protein